MQLEGYLDPSATLTSCLRSALLTLSLGWPLRPRDKSPVLMDPVISSFPHSFLSPSEGKRQPFLRKLRPSTLITCLPSNSKSSLFCLFFILDPAAYWSSFPIVLHCRPSPCFTSLLSPLSWLSASFPFSFFPFIFFCLYTYWDLIFP